MSSPQMVLWASKEEDKASAIRSEEWCFSPFIRINKMVEESIKRLDCSQGLADRISVLPVDVLHCILSCLPLQDSARTSILSRKWRHLWTTCPNIVFDRQFSMFLRDRSLMRSLLNFRDVVNLILLQHYGHISNFILEFTVVDVGNTSIDQWILFLCRNGGVEKLALHNSLHHATYSLPYCISFCPKLKILLITNCSLKLPYATEGFRKLEILKLEGVSFSESVGFHVLNTPNLTTFGLNRCSGIHYLRLHAPSLNNLFIHGCDIIELSTFLVMKELRRVHVSSSAVKIWGKIYNKTLHLSTLHCSWPNLQQLQLNEFLYQDVVAPVWSKHIIVGCLSCLCLPNFNPTNMKHVSEIMCLLGSTPYLTALDISIKASAPNSSSSMEAIAEYLEFPAVMNIKSRRLKYVELRGFTGLRTELILVKFLLASSSSLLAILIAFVEDISSDRFKIVKDLFEFPRASPEAVVKVVD